MNFLSIILSAASMAENDPHGWILSMVSVLVVFLSLTLLWLIFSLFFSPKNRARMRRMVPGLPSSKPASEPDSEVAAVIAAALDMDGSGEVYAAIAAALDMYLGEQLHDRESYAITIRRSNSPWASKSFNFRKSPKR